MCSFKKCVPWSPYDKVELMTALLLDESHVFSFVAKGMSTHGAGGVIPNLRRHTCTSSVQIAAVGQDSHPMYVPRFSDGHILAQLTAGRWKQWQDNHSLNPSDRFESTLPLTIIDHSAALGYLVQYRLDSRNHLASERLNDIIPQASSFLGEGLVDM